MHKINYCDYVTFTYGSFTLGYYKTLTSFLYVLRFVYSSLSSQLLYFHRDVKHYLKDFDQHKTFAYPEKSTVSPAFVEPSLWFTEATLVPLSKYLYPYINIRDSYTLSRIKCRKAPS